MFLKLSDTILYLHSGNNLISYLLRKKKTTLLELSLSPPPPSQSFSVFSFIIFSLYLVCEENMSFLLPRINLFLLSICLIYYSLLSYIFSIFLFPSI